MVGNFKGGIGNINPATGRSDTDRIVRVAGSVIAQTPSSIRGGGVHDPRAARRTGGVTEQPPPISPAPRQERTLITPLRRGPRRGDLRIQRNWRGREA